VEKTKRPLALPKKVPNLERVGYKKRSQPSSSEIPLEVYGANADFTPF